MALLIKETVTLKNTGGLQISEFIVGSYTTVIYTKRDGVLKIVPQVRLYLTQEVPHVDPTDYLRIEGFPEIDKFRMDYQYGVGDPNQVYWLEVQWKNLLLATFPDWKAENITLTTEIAE